MSYTAKPYQPPGKHSSLPRFNSKGDNDADKSQLATGTMPSLSGDILKQRIASLNTKQSSKTPLNKPGLGPKPSNGIKKPPPPKAQGVPLINATELMQRRESMHRTPPPPTPDSAKQKTEKTPEFLRKKLKPTKSKQNEEQKESGENDEATDDTHTKKAFRNSKLLFEKMSAQPPIAPKPRGKSVNQEKPEEQLKPPEIVSRQTASNDEAPAVDSKDENSVSNEGGPVRDEAPQDEAELTHKPTEADLIAESNEAVNQLDQVISAEESDDSTESDASAKPKDVTMPEIPPGLEAWLKKYVSCSCMLKKLNDLKSEGTPPPVLRDLKKPTVPAPSNVSNDQTAGNESNDAEIYDDVDMSASTGSKLNEETPAEVQEEIYDDVDTGAATVSAVVEEEVYDDIVGATAEQGTVKEEAQDIYDDVDTSAQVPLYEVEDEGDGEEPGMALYEPVETIQQYVTHDNVSLAASEGSGSPKLGTKGQTMDKANKKKEERERKEREKLEKKRKEEADKKMKKEEEERKKREKEEKKRVEKERKSFNLKPDEQPKLIERHMAVCDAKGKGKDLTFSRGEYLDVITKHNCPKGKCLVQNSSGKLGYASLKDLGIDKRKSLIEASSPVAFGVAFGDVEEEYEDICEQSNSSPTSSIMSLQSTRSGTSLANNDSQPRFSHFMKPSSTVQLGATVASSTVQLGATAAGDDNGGGEDIYEDI